MSLPTVVGIIASILTGVALLPQLIKVIREKKPHDISFLMLASLLGGVGLWVWYGILHDDWIIIISNSVSVILNLCTFGASFYYKNR